MKVSGSYMLVSARSSNLPSISQSSPASCRMSLIRIWIHGASVTPSAIRKTVLRSRVLSKPVTGIRLCMAAVRRAMTIGPCLQWVTEHKCSIRQVMTIISPTSTTAWRGISVRMRVLGLRLSVCLFVELHVIRTILRATKSFAGTLNRAS